MIKINKFRLRNLYNQLFDIKYSYLIQIIWTQLHGFKYFYLILIIHTVIWIQVIISIR